MVSADLGVLSWVCTLQCVTLAACESKHVQLGLGEHMAVMTPMQNGEGGEPVWHAGVHLCDDAFMWNLFEVCVKLCALPLFRRGTVHKFL
jgi:hypothetical protein